MSLIKDNKYLAASIIVLLIIIASSFAYFHFEKTLNNKKIQLPKDLVLDRKTLNYYNATFTIEFQSVSGLLPDAVNISVSGGGGAAILTYFSGIAEVKGLGNAFQYSPLSGSPQDFIAYISANSSTETIPPGAIMLVQSVNSFSTLTKSGLHATLYYSSLNGTTAGFLPIQLTGNLTLEGTQISTSPSGVKFNVAKVLMNFNPSSLLATSLVVTFNVSGIPHVLYDVGSTVNATWPSNQPEEIFTKIVNNVTEGPAAYCPYNGAYGPLSVVQSNEPLYVTIPYNSAGFFGDTVSISSSLYAGSLEVDL